MQPTPQLAKEYASLNKRGLIGLDFTLRFPLRPALHTALSWLTKLRYNVSSWMEEGWLLSLSVVVVAIKQ